MSKRNKIDRISFYGGLIGALVMNPRMLLDSRVQKANKHGWTVVQIVPHIETNLLIYILNIALLFLTLGLFNFSAGYLIVFEKEEGSDGSSVSTGVANESRDTKDSSVLQVQPLPPTKSETDGERSSGDNISSAKVVKETAQAESNSPDGPTCVSCGVQLIKGNTFFTVKGEVCHTCGVDTL